MKFRYMLRRMDSVCYSIVASVVVICKTTSVSAQPEMASSYLKAAQAYHQASAKTSCPQNKDCYEKQALYLEQLAAQLQNVSSTTPIEPECTIIECLQDKNGNPIIASSPATTSPATSGQGFTQPPSGMAPQAWQQMNAKDRAIVTAVPVIATMIAKVFMSANTRRQTESDIKDNRKLIAIEKYEQANNLIQEKQLSEGQKKLEEAITLDPEPDEYDLDRLFHLYVRIGEYDKAIAYQKGRISSKTDNISLAEAYLDLGYAYEKAGRYDEAITSLTKSMKYNQRGYTGQKIKECAAKMDSVLQTMPDPEPGTVSTVAVNPSDNNGAPASGINSESHFKLGKDLMGQRKYMEAIVEFNNALRLAPNDSVSLLSKAIAFHQANLIDSAQISYDLCVQNYPKYFNVYTYRADFRSDMGFDDSGIMNDLNQALLRYPNAGSLYHRRGTWFARLGEHEKAIEEFNRAFLMKDSSVLSEIGQSYFCLGNTGKAEKYLRLSLEHDTTVTQLRYLYLVYKERKKDKDKRNIYSLLLELSGGNVKPFIGIPIADVCHQTAKSHGYASLDGSLVVEVACKLPAAEAGIKKGDIILSIGHEHITNCKDVAKLIGQATPGIPIEIKIWRDGKELIVSPVPFLPTP